MNDAELRRGIAEWFDRAQWVARLLNELDSEIRDYYLYYSKPRDEYTNALREIPKLDGEHETYGDWLNEIYEYNATKIDHNIQEASVIIDQLGLVRTQWLGDRLLLAFPSLGFFECESPVMGTPKQRWKFACDRLFSAFEMAKCIWQHVKNYAHRKPEFRMICDMSPEEFGNGVEIAATMGVGVLPDSHLEAIENRLFAEMAQVLRDLSSENHTQAPQFPEGNEIPKPETDTQNAQLKNALSPDKSTLFWGGKAYPLTLNASLVVEKLIEVYPESLKQAYLMSECSIDTEIRHVVRDSKLTEVVIRPIGANGKNMNGRWRLIDPS